MTKTLVLFVFHQYNDRVEYFIKNCIFEHKKVHFILISNDKNYTFNVPKYVKTLVRDNIGYDFGGWSDALLRGNLYKNYDKFIFVNSSVIGPYLEPTFKGKWTDIYINGLKNNVKLFGSTINTLTRPLTYAHVQSYIFAVDKEALQHLINTEIFSMTNYASGYMDAVWQKEVLMSRKIVQKGWNIGSLLKIYNGVDFTFRTKKPEEYNIVFHGDLMFGVQRNVFWNEYDLVFIKGNRVPIDMPKISDSIEEKDNVD